MEFQLLHVAEFCGEILMELLHCLVRIYIPVSFEKLLKRLTINLLRYIIEVALGLAPSGNLLPEILQSRKLIIKVVLVGAGLIDEGHEVDDGFAVEPGQNHIKFRIGTLIEQVLIGMFILNPPHHPDSGHRTTMHWTHTIPTAFRIVRWTGITRMYRHCEFHSFGTENNRRVLPVGYVLVGEFGSLDAGQ